jgi:peptidyl-dipeptidase A
MNLRTTVCLAALALAGCATNTSAPPPAVAAAEPVPVAAPAEPALTAEGAREFVTAAEKDLGDLSLIGARAAWVNATYITDDTDALNTYFGTIATEKGVK